jgi:hypothetical protein
MNEAVFLHGARDARVALFNLREGRPGEALVDVAAVGICGSDLHSYKDGNIGSAINPCTNFLRIISRRISSCEPQPRVADAWHRTSTLLRQSRVGAMRYLEFSTQRGLAVNITMPAKWRCSCASLRRAFGTAHSARTRGATPQ